MATNRSAPADDDGGEEWGVPIAGTGGPLGANGAAVTDPSAYESEDDSPADRIARMLTVVSSDDRASVRLYRMRDGNSHKLDWCKNYTLTEFEQGDLELIRREWGPGEYQIRLYATRPPHKGGGFGIVAKEDIGIVADPRATAAPVLQRDSEISQMLKTMADGQQALLAALTQRPDPAAQLMQTMGLLAQMKEVFGVGQAPAASSQLGEIIKAVRELREVSAEINPPTPPDESGGLFPMAGQVIELVKTAMASKQAPGEPMPQLLVPDFPPIQSSALPVMQRPRHPSTPPAAPVVTLENEPVKMTPTAQAAQAAAQPAGEAPEIALLRSELRTVLGMAHAGRSPSDGADLLYERMPDEALDLLEMPQWFELLCQFEPDCKPCEAWLREAHKLLVAMLDEDAQAEESGPDPGMPAPAAPGDLPKP